MKRTSIIVLFIAAAFTSCSQNDSVTARQSRLEDAQDVQLLSGYCYSVDKEGNSSDTSICCRQWYTSANQLVKEEKLINDSRGHHRIIKHYDTSGKLIKKEGIYKDSTFISNVEFERDEKGEILIQIFSGTDGNIVLKHKNVYNEKGKLLRSSMSSPGDVGGNASGETLYAYDQNGMLSGFRQFMGGKLFSESSFTYDGKGNKNKEITISDGKTETFVFLYDLNRKKIEQKCFIDSELQSTTTYIWSDGHVKEEKTVFVDGSSEVIFYK